MSATGHCEHPEDSGFLEDIEYKEDESIKTVSLNYQCRKCGNYYSKYFQKQKVKK